MRREIRVNPTAASRSVGWFPGAVCKLGIQSSDKRERESCKKVFAMGKCKRKCTTFELQWHAHMLHSTQQMQRGARFC